MIPTNIKNENYTPAELLDRCRVFMNGIDLDPFASVEYSLMPAHTTIFTEETDGLSQDWSNYYRKWVNPPYSGGLITPCILKTLQYTHIGQTLLLVNTSSSSRWYQACLQSCSAMLFFSKRLQFWNPYEKRSNSNLYSQTMFYFGKFDVRFCQELRDLGTVAMPFLPPRRNLTEIEELVLKGGLK
jgi:hypothetical protein